MENNPTYAATLAALSILNQHAALDMSADDFAFVTSDQMWIHGDRSRARRCVESIVYGTLDYVGYPRFAVPAEFIAGAIAFYVAPANLLTACHFMEGCEFSENIISGIERTVTAPELMAHVLRIKSGDTSRLITREKGEMLTLKMSGHNVPN